MRPDDLARFSVIKLKLHGHLTGDGSAVYFLERVESSPDHELPFRSATKRAHGLIIPRGTKHANQIALEHFGWGLSPTTVLVCTDLVGADAIRNRRSLKHLWSANACY